MGCKSIPEKADCYPVNLLSRGHDPSVLDYESYNDQLRDDAGRLFVEDEKIYLKVNEVGGKDHIIHSLGDLGTYLENSVNFRGTRIFLIPQEFSWGSLLISEEAFRKLFGLFAVDPSFIDFVRAFGERSDFFDDTYGGYRFHPCGTSPSFACCYLMKYVEQHDRKEDRDPWSVRQMAVYHKHDSDNGVNSFFVLGPSKPFQRRLKRARDHSKLLETWQIHALLLSSSIDRWRWYVTFLEQQYCILRTKAQISSVNGCGEGDATDAGIRFSDVQDIQILQDKTLRALQFLRLNSIVLVSAQKHQRSFCSAATQEHLVSNRLASCLITETNVQIQRAQTLRDKLAGIMALIRSILDFRCLTSLQQNSNNMTIMTRLAHKDTVMMVELTERASCEAKALKLITLITLLYLPATFVATLLSMDYIKLRTVGDRIVIHFAEEMWIFVLLTSILLTLTIGCYIWWKRPPKEEAVGP